MPFLLAILFAAATSEVKSPFFACSNHPVHSNLYSLAQQISSWKPQEIPEVEMPKRMTVQLMIDKILKFKKQYEVEEDEDHCDSLLCKHFQGLWWNEYEEPAQWQYVPTKYRVVLEEYNDQVVRGVYNLSSAYCLVASKKIQEVVDMCKNLKKYSEEIYYTLDFFVEDIVLFARELDKKQCLYLNLFESRSCPSLNYNDKRLNELPEQAVKELFDMINYCDKVRDELKTMMGPGIECEILY